MLDSDIVSQADLLALPTVFAIFGDAEINVAKAWMGRSLINTPLLSTIGTTHEMIIHLVQSRELQLLDALYWESFFGTPLVARWAKHADGIEVWIRGSQMKRGTAMLRLIWLKANGKQCELKSVLLPNGTQSLYDTDARKLHSKSDGIESLLQTLEGNSAKNDFLDLWDFQINPDRVEVDLTSTSSDQKPTETTQTKQKRKRSEEEDKASLRDSRMIDPPIDEGSADDLAVTLVKRRRQTKGKRKRSEEEDEVSLRDSRMATPSPDQGSADDLAVTLVKRRRLMASSMSPAAPIAARKKVKASLKEVQPVSDEEESMYDSLSEILEDEWMGDSQSEPSVDEWHLSETSGDDWMYCSLSEASEASEESSEESSDDRDSFSFSFDTQPGISVATNIERLVDHCFEHNVDDKESSREDQRVQKLLEEVKFRLEQRGDPSDDLAEVEHKEHMDRVQVYLAMIDQIDAWSDEITKRLSKRHKKAALVSMLLRRNSLLHKIPQLKQRQRPSTLLRTMMAGVSCWISRRLQTHFLCVRPIYFGSSMSFLRWNMQMTAMSGDRSDTYELGISTDQLDHDETTQQLRIPRVERSLRSKESERQRGEKSPLEEQNDSESLDLEKTIKAARAETRPSMLGQLSGAVEYIAVRMGCDVASYVSKEQLMDGKAAERIAELGRLTLTRLAEEDAAFQQRLTAHGNKWPKARAGISEQHKAWWTPTFIQNKQKYTGKLYSRKDRA